MFDHTHYVPILKGKRGEFKALRDLEPVVRANLTPVIEIPFISQYAKNDSVEHHILREADYIANYWGIHSAIFIDLRMMNPSKRTRAGEHPLAFLLQMLRNRNVLAIPVTGLQRDPAYQDAVRDALAMDDRGFMIRLEDEDFGRRLKSKINRMVQQMGQTALHDVHLLLDLGFISSDNRNGKRITAMAMYGLIPDIEDWATITLAGSSVPELSPISPGQTQLYNRLEWDVWTKFVLDEEEEEEVEEPLRIPSYGDYGITSRDISDVDPRIMRVSPKLTYTTKKSWYMTKKKRDADGRFSTFRKICSELVRKTGIFSGADFSKGDRYIDECAKGISGPGSAETWISTGTNHHLTFVVKQISNFPFP